MIKVMTDLPSLAAYLNRIGAEPRSMLVAVVKEQHGQYWQDVAVIRIDKKSGDISADEGYGPTESEAVTIKQEILSAEWPTSVKLGKNYELPEQLKHLKSDDIFELRDRSGKLIMLQVRMTPKKNEAEKRYVPWTYWSDKEWRKAEPEGLLPLWGLENIGDHTTAFIHEGAKAARAVTKLINPRTAEEIEALKSHPWGKELSGAVHLGWIGGALNPYRTDWSELQKAGIQRVYIVADNDRPGKAAIPRISFSLRGMLVFSIEFTEVWPASFDLADPFPKKMFSKIGPREYYNGPTFRDVLHPATWATDVIPQPKGKKVYALRKEFVDLWVWVESTDTFICKEMPEINHQMNQFNAMVAPFSHVIGTGQLLHKSYKGRTAKMCYRPDIAARIVTDRTTSAINLHTPSTIKPEEGDAAPWEDFLNYLFPVEREREDVKRWCATLIARPETRMLFGMLLVSERQGMGKSTLGERILAPLVGYANTGFPGERDIVESNFNGWIANKRLIVVGEIYTGQSFKAYNILKSYLTDKNINVNEKFQRPYTIENWVHVVACSNSKKALRIEETDRRWFYPTVAEIPWTREQWSRFYEWLGSGGLGIIANWAKNYGSYVLPGEHAPMTVSKQALIEDSKGEVLNHWIDILSDVEENDEAVAFALNEVKAVMKKYHSRVFESPLEFKKEAVKRGWVALPERIGIDGGLSVVVMSPKLNEQLSEKHETASPAEFKALVKAKIQRMIERISGAM
jgi:hypothetical protein